MTTAVADVFDLSAQPQEPVACGLCGGTETTVVAERDRYGLPVRVVRCVGCGLRYLNPRMTAEGYTQFYAGAYRALLTALTGRSYTPRDIEPEQWRYALELSAIVERWMPAGGTLLDLGGSTGIVGRFFRARFGLEPTVVDPSAEELARAIGCTTVCGPAESVTFDPASFDVIVCARTVDHLLEPRTVLERARTWVKPGGVLVIDAMNVDAWPAGSQYKVDHPYAFTTETIQKLVTAAGWKVRARWDRRGAQYVGLVCSPQESGPDA